MEMRHGIGEMTVEGVAREADRLGLLKRVENGQTWVTTRDVLNEESRMIAFSVKGNRRSELLLERSGFGGEGCLRSYRVGRGQARDFYVYGLLRSDWAAAQKSIGADGARR